MGCKSYTTWKKAFDDGVLTIREHLLRKCWWYYRLEKILHWHPNFTGSYIKKAGLPDQENSNVVNKKREKLENKDEGEKKDKEIKKRTKNTQEVFWDKWPLSPKQDGNPETVNKDSEPFFITKNIELDLILQGQVFYPRNANMGHLPSQNKNIVLSFLTTYHQIARKNSQKK